MPAISSPDDEQLHAELEAVFGKGKGRKYARVLLAVLSSLPWVGGFFSGAVALSSESEQGKVNELFRRWMEEHQEQAKRLSLALLDVFTRLDGLGEQIQERIESDDYLQLGRKAFRTWDAADTDEKRRLIQNLIANAGATKLCSDDIVRLFINWINYYHEIHFRVIREIYRQPGITRGGIWAIFYGASVREDSAEADLFSLLIRDLSTGGVIRQHRETTYDGQFVKKSAARSRSSSHVAKSRFDDNEPYELTQLGRQFVHYTMNEIVPRVAGGTQEQPV